MKLFKNNAPLGELEAEVMETAWRLKKATVRDVLSQLKKKRLIAYTTIMTVMDRLYKKNILSRSLNQSGAYIYYPARTKDQFLALASKSAIKSLIKNFGEVAVAQFIDTVGHSSQRDLEQWRQKLKNIK